MIEGTSLDYYFLPLQVFVPQEALLPLFGAVGAGVLAGLAAGLAADFAIFLSFHKMNSVIIAHFHEICAVFSKKSEKYVLSDILAF